MGSGPIKLIQYASPHYVAPQIEKDQIKRREKRKRTQGKGESPAVRVATAKRSNGQYT
jgi:hypothetical protein